jgi:hypothetical protein
MSYKDLSILSLLYIWQLPQHLLGYIFLKIWKNHVRLMDSPLMEQKKVLSAQIYIITQEAVRGHKLLSLLSGFSLGRYIVLHESCCDPVTIRHELGHSIQSAYLGPLYLLVVGLPSVVCNNLWDRWFHKNWTAQDRIRWYYRRFPEKWADSLGGVGHRYRTPPS